MYLPEEIRDKIADRIADVSTKHSSFYRAPAAQYDSYPAYVLEYAQNENMWSSSGSDKKNFIFNLYVVYQFENDEASQELAEVAISDAIGELYRVVFEDTGVLELPNGWIYASDVSWGYGGTEEAPTRIAQMQLRVTVHQDRS